MITPPRPPRWAPGAALPAHCVCGNLHHIVPQSPLLLAAPVLYIHECRPARLGCSTRCAALQSPGMSLQVLVVDGGRLFSWAPFVCLQRREGAQRRRRIGRCPPVVWCPSCCWRAPPGRRCQAAGPPERLDLPPSTAKRMPSTPPHLLYLRCAGPFCGSLSILPQKTRPSIGNAPREPLAPRCARVCEPPLYHMHLTAAAPPRSRRRTLLRARAAISFFPSRNSWSISGKS